MKSNKMGVSSVMDKKKLKYFGERLEQKRQGLAAVVHKTENYGRENDAGETQDLADQANSSYQKEFLFSKSNGDRNLLQLVKQALARIHDSSYGLCTHCGSEVEPKRLEAVPWTPHCLSCQELAEKGLLE